MDLKKLAQEFEAQQRDEQLKKEEVLPITGTAALPVVKTENPITEQSSVPGSVGFTTVVGGVQKDILNKAKEKISDEKIVDKHAESLKNIADKALEAQAELASLTVQEQEADNKVRKQEIRNKLIVLKAEAQRLEREQKQLNKEQKADHIKRNKEAQWELYKNKLEKMKYSYVPNKVVLWILLFTDGARSFFNGLGTISTAIVGALKWVLIGGAILIVLFSIPVTREWLINLLSGG